MNANFLLFFILFIPLSFNILHSSSFHDEYSLEVKKNLQKIKNELYESEKKATQYSIDDSMNPKENDIFWYLRDHHVYSLTGYNNDFLKKFLSFKNVYSELVVDHFIPIQDISHDEPILVNNKPISDVFSPEDYPNFNPILFFHENLSIGERERIKKSLILIKIVLHSDSFPKHITMFQEIYGISNFYAKNLFLKNILPSQQALNYVSNAKDITNFILYQKKAILIQKTKFKTATDDNVIIADAAGNITIYSHDLVPVNYLKKIRDGFIRFHNNGKPLNSYSPFLPVSLFHEYLHTLGYPHTNPINYYDLVYQISHRIFFLLYVTFQFPKIPYNCYKGMEEKWANC